VPAPKPKKPAATLIFPDPGFHLAVLGALVDAELFDESRIESHVEAIADELSELDEDDENARLELVLRQLHTLPLPAAKVAKIEALDFDGGNTIYMTLEQLAETNSGGETEVYSVGSLAGISALTRLGSLDLDSHGSPANDELRDLSPLADLFALEEVCLCDCEHADVLLGLPKLRQVRVLGASATVEPGHVLAALEAKGVVVERL